MSWYFDFIGKCVIAILATGIIGFMASFGWHEAKSIVEIGDELRMLEHVEKAFKEKKEESCK